MTAALVGPTGCGKTLTIAKLAAIATIDHGRAVALATTDVHRVAAARQLQAFAEFLGVPCAVAGTPRDLRNFLEQWHNADVVLIDTGGQSPTDAGRLVELAAYLPPHVQVHLVLAANLRESLLESALDAYRILNYQRLILTKLDETSATGAIGSLAALSTTPVSYITTGQNVPDDLEPADSHRLAEIALGYARVRPPAAAKEGFHSAATLQVPSPMLGRAREGSRASALGPKALPHLPRPRGEGVR